MRGRLKHRGTEKEGRGWCEGGLSVGSVALCFYSPDRCADGGKHRGTEARRKKEGEGEGEGEAGKGKGMVRRGALCGLCGSVFLFGARTQ